MAAEDLPPGVDVDPRDEDCEEWDPELGPFEWETERSAAEGTWHKNGVSYEGLALVDEADEGRACLASTLFCPDLILMR